MHRGAGSILILVVALVQCSALCACRAEWLANAVACHTHDSDGATETGTVFSICTPERAATVEGCDSYAQAKRPAAQSGLVSSLLPPSGFRLLAPTHLRASASPGGPPTDDSGLSKRSVPLLI